MAKLTVSSRFSAMCGTAAPQRLEMNVSLTVSGPVRGDFVAGADDGLLAAALRRQLSVLEGRHLDDVVGRATLENIANYVFYQMREFEPYSVEISKGDRQAVVYREDIRLDSYETDLLFDRAISFALRGKDVVAIELLSMMVTQKPSAKGFNARGRCRRRLGDLDGALNDFDRSVAEDPGFGEAHRNRGNILLERGCADEALRELTVAVELMPSSALAWNNRGYCLLKLEKPAEALADHAQAIAIDPTYEEAHRDKAAALQKLSRRSEAEQVLAAAESLVGRIDAIAIERAKLKGESVSRCFLVR